jgi:hypothetical protein
VAGKPKKFTLGPYPRLTLADAREQARATLRTASEGLDPGVVRAAAELEAEAATKLRFVGVDGPLTASLCQNEVVADLKHRRPSVEQIIRIGIDTSKHVFQLHGVNAAEEPVLRKKRGGRI